MLQICAPFNEGHICFAGALQHMQQSSAEAAACLRAAGATGCTDVTGFGLIGHLGEMTRASQVGSCPSRELV